MRVFDAGSSRHSQGLALQLYNVAKPVTHLAVHHVLEGRDPTLAAIAKNAAENSSAANSEF